MPKPNAIALRQLAEGADGTRDQDVFYQLEDGSLTRKPTAPSSEYITVNTPWSGPGLRGDTTLSATNCNIPPTADAVFSTQSAFEKFVLPYYVRTKTLDELKQMLDEFYRADVVAIYHEPDSAVSDAKREGLYKARANGTNTII